MVNSYRVSTELIDKIKRSEIGIKFIFSWNETDFYFKNDQGLIESGIFSYNDAKEICQLWMIDKEIIDKLTSYMKIGLKNK